MKVIRMRQTPIKVILVAAALSTLITATPPSACAQPAKAAGVVIEEGLAIVFAREAESATSVLSSRILEEATAASARKASEEGLSRLLGRPVPSSMLETHIGFSSSPERLRELCTPSSFIGAKEVDHLRWDFALHSSEINKLEQLGYIEQNRPYIKQNTPDLSYSERDFRAVLEGLGSFKEEHKLPFTDRLFDDRTIEAIDKKIQQYTDHLYQLGYSRFGVKPPVPLQQVPRIETWPTEHLGRSTSEIARLEEMISAYQAEHHLSVTGFLDPETRIRISNDVSIKREVVGAAQTLFNGESALESQSLKRIRFVFDASKAQVKKAYFLVSNRGESELWICSQAGVEGRLRGVELRDLLFKFDCQTVSLQSDKATLGITVSAINDNGVSIGVGNQTLALTKDEYVNLLMGNPNQRLQDAINASNTHEVFLFESSYFAGNPESLPAHAKDLYPDIRRVADGVRKAFGSRVTVGRDFRLAKLNTLNATKPVESGKLGVYIDQALSGSKLIEPSLKIISRQVVNEPDVILIAGHKSAPLRKTLTEMGKHGRLAGKMLALFSCEAGDDIAFQSVLISKYGLNGVIAFPEKLSLQASMKVAAKVTTEISSGSKLEFRDLLQKCLERCISSEVSPQIKESMQLMRSYYLQVSANITASGMRPSTM